MERKSPKLLEDIRDAAAFIRQATAGKTLDDYRSDRLLRQAIERNFEIIGEAVGRLANVDPTTASRIGEYQQIISFRNVLIHGYDLIDEAQVWEIIRANLPTLEADVTALLAGEGVD
ncbi:MAG: HepT-like ribonuclease domain-containing protein [Pirellulales bacterium]